MPRLPRVKPPTISELTRRDIFDALTVEGTAWFGRLEEPAFLERVWDLNDMPSTDPRFEYDPKSDLLNLYKAVAKALKLNAESVPDSAKGSQAAQGALRALGTTVQRLAELRNELGLGHGRNRTSTAQTRHARLAFNAASTVTELLLDTWHERRDDVPDSTSVVAANGDKIAGVMRRLSSPMFHGCSIGRSWICGKVSKGPSFRLYSTCPASSVGRALPW